MAQKLNFVVFVVASYIINIDEVKWHNYFNCNMKVPSIGKFSDIENGEDYK